MIDTKEIDDHVEASRTTLEDCLAKDEPFRPMLMVYRGDRLRAQVIPMDPGNDGGAVIQFQGELCAALFRATDLVIVMDSYSAKTPTNPITGQEWQHGDMADVAENHNGRAEGWVFDAICLIFQDRAGAEALIEIPYRVVDGHIEWEPEQRFGLGEPGTESGGGRLSGLFEPPPGMPEVPEDMSDMAAAKLVTYAGAMVALAQYSDE